jgi:hypothetical protein
MRNESPRRRRSIAAVLDYYRKAAALADDLAARPADVTYEKSRAHPANVPPDNPRRTYH